jgi:anthranilate synthase/aminodeoxychorismate synthase-like glutamine amidotransferase
MIIVIDNYDSFTYNLVQYLGELGAEMQVYRNDAITVEQAAKRKPQALVVSPGPKTPDHAGISMALIKKFAGKIPVLGICLGCQSMGQIFGGKVGHARKLMHGKSSEITHTGEGIMKGIPNPFIGGRYHSLIVELESLPSNLKVIARSPEGEIMGIMHRELLDCYGLQFHPESILTPEGKKILRNFLNLC